MTLLFLLSLLEIVSKGFTWHQGSNEVGQERSQQGTLLEPFHDVYCQVWGDGR